VAASGNSPPLDVETAGIIRPPGIAEIGRAAGEGVGTHRRPGGIGQVPAGFHHHDQIRCQTVSFAWPALRASWFRLPPACLDRNGPRKAFSSSQLGRCPGVGHNEKSPTSRLLGVEPKVRLRSSSGSRLPPPIQGRPNRVRHRLVFRLPGRRRHLAHKRRAIRWQEFSDRFDLRLREHAKFPGQIRKAPSNH